MDRKMEEKKRAQNTETKTPRSTNPGGRINLYCATENESLTNVDYIHA